MKKCPYCGAPVENKNDTMCAYCGSPFSGAQDASSQYSTEEHYDPRLPIDQQPAAHQDYSERLRQAIQRQAHQPTQQEEIAYKAKIAKYIGIFSIVFSTMIIPAIIALVLAGSVLNDSRADETAKATARTARTLGIISIILGIIFFLGQIPLMAVLSM